MDGLSCRGKDAQVPWGRIHLVVNESQSGRHSHTYLTSIIFVDRLGTDLLRATTNRDGSAKLLT
jgi:hypothetical protein